MKKYIKIPVEVEAIQWIGRNRTEIELFVGQQLECSVPPRQAEHDRDLTDDAFRIDIPTKEGSLTATRGDYIVKGNSEELGDHFWPVKPDYFKSAYELVKDNDG